MPEVRKTRPLQWDSGRCIPIEEFGRVLAEVELTKWRCRMLQAYAANPRGLTVIQLGRILRRASGMPHSVGNAANAGFARGFASKLGLVQGHDKTWWVGATFETCGARSPLGHMRFRIVEPLRTALTKDRGEWGRAWKIGKTKGSRAPAEIEPEPARRVSLRLARDRQPKFRKQLLELYGSRCAVTGCNVEAALEACHIDRYADTLSNALENGIVLRADLHRLFDAGLIVLRVDGKHLSVRVHPDIADARIIRSLDRKKLKFEPDSHAPDRSRIRRHEKCARKRAHWPAR